MSMQKANNEKFNNLKIKLNIPLSIELKDFFLSSKQKKEKYKIC